MHNLVLLENCVVVLSRSLNMFLFSIFEFFDATVIMQKKQEVFSAIMFNLCEAHVRFYGLRQYANECMINDGFSIKL